ncbi:MAG: hypothetical protein IJV22_04630 [Bacteroidales bacterium]|nr:hypothetical protein [Bacteroidales bacterium]
MKTIDVTISGRLLVPEEASYDEIYEAVRFNVGLNGQMSIDNPVGMDLEWVAEDIVEIREAIR